MKALLPILACCVLAFCTHPRYSMPWVPITDPVFKEIYGEHAPTLEAIFGGQGSLALLDRPGSVTVFRLRPMNETDQSDKITTLGFFAAVGPGKPLSWTDYQPLFAALQSPGNYGDQFLGVTSADFGYKIISGSNVLDIVFDLETPSVTIACTERRHNDRRAVSLVLVEAACRVAQQHLKPDTDYRKRIGRERVIKVLHSTSEPAPCVTSSSHEGCRWDRKK